jgi:hypothetical protein
MTIIMRFCRLDSPSYADARNNGSHLERVPLSGNPDNATSQTSGLYARLLLG